MRVFAVGLGTETNSFCPIPTTIEDFKNDLFEGMVRGKTGAFEAWNQACDENGCTFARGSNLWAMPAGPTNTRDFYLLRDRLIEEIREFGDIDILLLNLHGAMIAQNIDDCEGDLLAKVRKEFGEDLIIGAELDPHAHLTDQMLEAADIIVEYKEFPHDDIAHRARDLLDLCLRAKRHEIQPVMKKCNVGAVLLIQTKASPGDALVKALHEAESKPGIVSASLNHGFPWGDTPNAGVSALVISDGDSRIAEQEAGALADQVWSVRELLKVGIDSLPLSQAIEVANRTGKAGDPIVLCESGDNLTGGGAGDATHLLEAMVNARMRSACFGPIWDPVAVDIAMAAGEGAELTLRVGGKAGVVSGRPVDLEVTISTIRENYWHGVSSEFGFSAGHSVCLTTSDGLDVVISAERYPVFSPSLFTDFGIDLSQKSVIGIKALHMARIAFAEVANRFQLVTTPAAMSQDLSMLPFKHGAQNLWPLHENQA